jgi:hypothetical protein
LDITTTHMDGIMDGVLDFHTVIPTGVLAFHTDIRTITLHGILHGTLPGTVIHTGEGQGMDIMAGITEITIVMAMATMTITDHIIECIMEEVIHYRVIAEPVDQYQTQGLPVRREFHVT